MTFKELNLSAPLLRAVQEAGYETPSPIQAAAIPPVLAGRDLMGCAQTGTGKTAAFALPMLDWLTANAPRRKGAVRALILTPTRELALQIGESFEAYGKYLKLRSTVIFGGVGQAPQVADSARVFICPFSQLKVSAIADGEGLPQYKSIPEKCKSTDTKRAAFHKREAAFFRFFTESWGKSSLGARLRTRKVTGRDASLPAPC